MLFKKTSQSNYNTFSNLRAYCKSRSKINYSNNYILKMQNTNPKLFWKFFSQKKLNSSFPNTMSYNNNLISGVKDINCFANYFSNVYVDNLITPTYTN